MIYILMIVRDPEILTEERLWERWSAVHRTGQDNESCSASHSSAVDLRFPSAPGLFEPK
jgi:hypothetical protein